MKQESHKLSSTEKDILKSWISDYNENKKQVKLNLEQVDFTDISNHQQFDVESAWNTIESKIDQTPIKSMHSLSPKNHWWKIAASIVILAACFLTLNKLSSTHDNAQIIVHKNDSKNARSILLPDGSKVFLNTDATVSYDVKTFEKTRIIDFDGLAYFDISKQIGKNFIVKTTDFEVEVLGTEFQINTTKGEKKVIVTEGIVKLSKGSSNLKLTANEQALIDENIVKTTKTNHNELAWHTQTISFDNTSIKEYLRDVSDFYDVQFDLVDVDLTCKITTSYTTETLLEALDELKMIFGIDYKVEQKLVTIRNLQCK